MLFRIGFWFFHSYFSYKNSKEIVNLKASSNLNDSVRIKFDDNKLQSGTNVLISKTDHPIDVSLMYKEINQCQNIIDRLEKILGYVRNENTNPMQIIDSKKNV